jgi:hypothetical protein
VIVARSRRVLMVWAVALVVAVTLVVWRLDGRGADDARSAAAAETSGPTAAAPRDNGVTNGDGTEVIRRPEGPDATGQDGLRPTVAPSTGSLVKGPLPKTASRQGGLVAGFPASVVPVLPGSAVDSSGVSSTQGAVQVSIVANSPRSRDAVLAYYRRQLGAQGFAESVVPGATDSVGAGFLRGTDHLVVTATAVGPTTSYSLFGTLHARAHG